jgi:hypothetical protein
VQRNSDTSFYQPRIEKERCEFGQERCYCRSDCLVRGELLKSGSDKQARGGSLLYSLSFEKDLEVKASFDRAFPPDCPIRSTLYLLSSSSTHKKREKSRETRQKDGKHIEQASFSCEIVSVDRDRRPDYYCLGHRWTKLSHCRQQEVPYRNCSEVLQT